MKDRSRYGCIYVKESSRAGDQIYGWFLHGKLGGRDGNIRVVSYKTSLEVGNTKERLGLLVFPGGRPMPHDFYLQFVHLKAVRAYDEAYKVGGIDAKGAFIEFYVQIVGAQSAEDLLYMLGIDFCRL